MVGGGGIVGDWLIDKFLELEYSRLPRPDFAYAVCTIQ